MAEELILLTIFFAIVAILLLRYMVIIPRMIFWVIARDITKDDYSIKTPSAFGIAAEFVEIPMKNKSIHALFLPSEGASTAGILLIPNWYKKSDLVSSLKMASIIRTAGYNVLLPIYHWSLDETSELVQFKRKSNPKECQKVINESYNYFTKRPEVDRRNIGIWSSGSGTILACQLIKNQPIKGVVLEDGPVTLWNELPLLFHKRVLTRFLSILLLFPFVWRTRWQSKGAVKNLRSCPSFLIATREEPQKGLWKTFSILHEPRQLWFEHALQAGSIGDSWLHEYCLQVRSFFDLWLLDSPKPEFHYEFVIKQKRKGKYFVEIRITSMPPQVDKVPLQIILSDNSRFSENRIWFDGGSMTVSHSLEFKPNSISVIPFANVEPTDHPKWKWSKRDARVALYSTIEKLINYAPEKLDKLMERYFFLKSILLNEQDLKEEALEVLKSYIKSKHWKNIMRNDADCQLILHNDLEEPQISSSFYG